MTNEYPVGSIIKSAKDNHAIVLDSSNVVRCDASGSFVLLNSSGDLYISKFSKYQIEFAVIGIVEHEIFVGIVSAWRRIPAQSEGRFESDYFDLTEEEYNAAQAEDFAEIFLSTPKFTQETKPIGMRTVIIRTEQGRNNSFSECRVKVDGYYEKTVFVETSSGNRDEIILAAEEKMKELILEQDVQKEYIG